MNNILDTIKQIWPANQNSVKIARVPVSRSHPAWSAASPPNIPLARVESDPGTQVVPTSEQSPAAVTSNNTRLAAG